MICVCQCVMARSSSAAAPSGPETSVVILSLLVSYIGEDHSASRKGNHDFNRERMILSIFT